VHIEVRVEGAELTPMREPANDAVAVRVQDGQRVVVAGASARTPSSRDWSASEETLPLPAE